MCLNSFFCGSICMLLALCIQPEVIQFIRKVYHAETEEKVENRGRPKGSKNKSKTEVKVHYMIAFDHASGSMNTIRKALDKLSGIHEPNTEVDVDEVRKEALEAVEAIDYVMKCLKGLCTPSEAVLMAYRVLDEHLTELYDVTREAYCDQMEESVCAIWSQIDECMDMFKTLYGIRVSTNDSNQ